jgi:hypothetical protein
VLKDNRIPPRGYTVAAYDRAGAWRPMGAAYADGQYWDETTLCAAATCGRAWWQVLYYQTSSKEYIDFLRTNGGADGVVLGQMWDELKSPPEVMDVAIAPAQFAYLPMIRR